MALNSAVTSDGGEIGRAQALQAQACGLTPHTDMNPVLLKPNTDVGAQVIIQGKAVSAMDARSYHDYKPIAMRAVMESYQRLQKQHDVVLVEGAGSPAEINLRQNDIANMGFAEKADCPVLLIADINRGGVFAHLSGTLALLSDSEQARIKGLVINRFRGDLEILKPGIDWQEQYSSKPILGVLPFLQGLHLDAEDALQSQQHTPDGNALNIIVPVTPRISNHTDFDPLRLHPHVNISFIRQGEAIPAADLIILPGSKSVRHDLQWLLDQGWQSAIARHLRYGGKLLGICGGYQMLGHELSDPLGLEGTPGSCAGLGLLDFSTKLEPEKQLRNVSGMLLVGDSAEIHGYEIHAGVSEGAALDRPLINLGSHTDGARSADDQIIGTYLHGLFETPEACRQLLHWAGLKESKPIDYHALREEGINRMADAVEEHLDTKFILGLVGR